MARIYNFGAGPAILPESVLEEAAEGVPEFASKEELDGYLAGLETQMREAAKKFEFEKAAKLRDTIKDLRAKEFLVG